MGQILTLVLMILIAAFSRFIPHPWNFTAIGAMALFGGAYLPSKSLSLIIPIAALVLTDLILGFHSTIPFVYGAFLLTVGLGWMLREKRGVMRVGVLALVSSSLFFLISNFGVWAVTPLYNKTLGGLILCYVSAIPFFDNQVYGDLFFSGLLFGGYELAKKYVPEFTVPSVQK